MKTIQIKHRYTGNVLFEHSAEENSVLITIKQAISVRADLSGAVLRSADLSGADLSGAVLRSADLSGAVLRSAVLRSAVLRSAVLRSAVLSGADLRSAVLSGADLRSADLSGADLSGADLSGAVLRSADLRSADLSGADLSGADLRSAVLSGADLSGAVLRSADLRPIKHDLFGVLLYAQHEVPGMLKAVQEGRVDGSTYSGDCACLVGTICNLRSANVELPGNILNIPKASDSAIERWFLALRPGDTPENSVIAKITEEWILEFMVLTGQVIPSDNASPQSGTES